jgi:hypothetical protein
MPEGQALLIGWYDTDPAYQPELDAWHSKEHMPERAALPGFLTAQRFRSLRDPGRYCVLYRVTGIEVFVSEPYLNVLNNPTEWTRKMMPGVRDMNRTLCAVAERRGGGFGSILHTIKCSPPPDGRHAFVGWLSEEAFPAALTGVGVVKVELAIADQDASRLKTQDQGLRGKPDEIADWVVLVEAYSVDEREASGISGPLSDLEIEVRGATVTERESFQLVHLISSV